MPQYDYKSDDGDVVTITASIFDDKPATVTRNDKVYRRIFGQLPIVYKVMGFYSTDNASSIERWRRENLQGE